MWISNIDAKGPLWHFNENGKPQGEYDAVVVAYNGKVFPYHYEQVFFTKRVYFYVYFKLLVSNISVFAVAWT